MGGSGVGELEHLNLFVTCRRSVPIVHEAPAITGVTDWTENERLFNNNPQPHLNTATNQQLNTPCHLTAHKEVPLSDSNDVTLLQFHLLKLCFNEFFRTFSNVQIL